MRERDCDRESRQLCARSRYDRRHRWRQVDDDDDEEEEKEKLALNIIYIDWILVSTAVQMLHLSEFEFYFQFAITHLNTNQNIDILKPLRRCNCNPDNIATPIAASLGDVVTLGLLAWISDVLYVDYTLGGCHQHCHHHNIIIIESVIKVMLTSKGQCWSKSTI